MPNGKICYLEIPATDVDASAVFYTKVFGWKARVRGDGSRAFDDTTGAVSGSWVRGRKPAREPGVLAYVMVDDIDATLRGVLAAGGQMATPRTTTRPAPGRPAIARNGPYPAQASASLLDVEGDYRAHCVTSAARATWTGRIAASLSGSRPPRLPGRPSRSRLLQGSSPQAPVPTRIRR